MTDTVRAEPPTDGDRQISLKAIMELVGRRQGELLASTLTTRRGRWLELGKLLVDLESLGAAEPPSAPAPRLEAIVKEAKSLADLFECKTPGNGGPTPGHCAACCGNTLIEASCQEEFDFAVALNDLARIGERYLALGTPEGPKDGVPESEEA